MGASWSGTVATFAEPYAYNIGNYTAANYSATIDYGDGTAASAGTVTSDGNYGWIVTDTHAFAGVGTFYPTVTLNDLSNGNSYTANDSATIADVPPTLADDSPASVTGIEGQSFTGTLLHFNDANPYAQPSDFTAAIDWGDGSSDSQDSNISIVSDPNGGFDVVGTHTFASMNTYNVTVTATDPSGESVSNTVAATIAPITSTFTATPVNTGAIDLEWSLDVDPGTVSNIEVDRSTSPTSGFAAVPAAQYLPGDSVSYIDDNPPLTEGTQYYYELQVSMPSGTYTSPVVSAWTLPAAPTELAAVTDGGTVVLSWTNNSASSPPFVIERSDDGGATFAEINETDPGDETYTDAAPEDGTTEYRVDAVSGDGVSFSSSNVATVVNDLTPPSDLAAVAVSASEIDLSWTNNSQAADGVMILRSVGDASDFTTRTTLTDPTSQTYDDTGLTAGTDYYYEVEATQGSATSSPSNSADDTTIPATPAGLAVTVASPTELDLSWDATPGATGYDIQREAAGGTWQAVQQVTDGGTTFDDAGLWDGVTYSYQIDAFNNAGTSGTTAPQTATTLQTAPQAPTVQAVPVSDSAIQLIWVDNAYNESDFRIDRSDDGGNTYTTIAHVQPGVDTYTDTGLANGVYYYTVTAENATGEASGYAAAGTQPVAPDAPSGLTLGAVTATQVTLSWTPGAGVVTSQDLEVSGLQDWGTGETIPLAAGVTSYTVTVQNSYDVAAMGNLSLPPIDYYFSVRQDNAAGPSLWSNTVTTRTAFDSGSPPSDPTNFQLSSSETATIDCAEPPAPNGYTTVEAELAATPQDGGTPLYAYTSILVGGTVTLNSPQLAAGTAYTVSARLFNIAGYSAAIGNVSLTTPGTAPTPAPAMNVTVVSSTAVDLLSVAQ